LFHPGGELSFIGLAILGLHWGVAITLRDLRVAAREKGWFRSTPHLHCDFHK
jgi:hypothetical protein